MMYIKDTPYWSFHKIFRSLLSITVGIPEVRLDSEANEEAQVFAIR